LLSLLVPVEMSADGGATVELRDKHLAKIPEEVLIKSYSVGVLELSRNPGIQLHGVLRRFKNVTKLVLSWCALITIPDDISDITQVSMWY